MDFTNLEFEMLLYLTRKGILDFRHRKHDPVECDGIARCICTSPDIWVQTTDENLIRRLYNVLHPDEIKAK